MKRLLLAATCMVAVTSFAQKDSSTIKKPDTLQVGGFTIIKKNQPSKKSIVISTDGVYVNLDDTSKTARKKRNIRTNWLILDLGFANMRDNTNYGATGFGSSNYNNPDGIANGDLNKNSFRLKQLKTTNVNIWFFMQRLNVYKHVVNLKYGLGLEMYNFRYENNISFRKNSAAFNGPYAHMDSVGFSKNKLYASYLTVPLMVSIRPMPEKRKGFTIAAGVSAGYLFASRNKQISDERGKVKYRGDLDLQPWRLAGIAEIGLGPVRLYGSYSFNALHRESTGLNQYPYTVGLRFSSL